MTVSTVHQIPRSGVTDSPVKPPTTAAASAAIRVLALAVDLDKVSVARLADGSTRTEVSTIGMPPEVAERIWSELLAGMTSVVSAEWSAGSLLCREATGLLLGAPVRITGTAPSGQVAA